MTDYPVLLKLSTSSGIGGVDLTSIFTELGTNSLKLAVTGSDGVTPLYVEVVSWDATNRLAELWVKAPTVSGTVDTTLYIYYDSTHADNTSYVGITGSVPGKAVWDNNYVEVLHGNDATPSGSGEPGWAKTTKEFDDTDVKPFIIGGQRYIARSKSFGYGRGAIRIYSADANWNDIALITTAPTATADFSGVHVFPNLGNKVILWGNSGLGAAFVAQYDFDASAWTMTFPAGSNWIAQIHYRPADSLFYISTSYTFPGNAYYNTLQKSTAANLLIPANWVSVALPAWGGTWNGGDVEAVFTISGDYLYLTQTEHFRFYWQLSKWDFNSTWTPIESNFDGSPSLSQGTIMGIGGNDNLIVVPEAYNTPFKQWRIRTSTDGINWQTAYTLPMLPDVYGVPREQVAESFLYGNSFFINLTTTNSTVGYFLLSDQSGNSQVVSGVTSHSLESSIGDVLTDGTDMITGGQNPYGPTQLNILKWGIADPDNVRIIDSKTGRKYFKTAANEPIEVDGGIGKAQNFSGIYDYIDGGTDASPFTGTGDLTVDALIKQSNTASNVMMLYLGSDSSHNSVYLFVNNGFYGDTGDVEFGVYAVQSGASPYFAKGLMQDGNYHTIVGKKSGNDLSISLDGVTKDTKTVTGVNITAGYFSLGRAIGTYYWPGFESEVRISNIARSAAYIKANQSNFTDALVTYGDTVNNTTPTATPTSTPTPTESATSTATPSESATPSGTTATPSLSRRLSASIPGTVTSSASFVTIPTDLTNIEVGQTITFDASSSGSNITKYEWNFGDGTTSNEMKADHKYDTPGRYTVTLTTTDKSGNISTVSKAIDIRPPAPTISNIKADGTSIIFEGKSFPKATINLTIHSNPYTGQTLADKDGKFSYIIENGSETLGEGGHTVLANAAIILSDNTELTSKYSKTYDFNISLDNGKLKVEMGKTKTWQYVSLGLGLLLLLGIGFVLFRARKRRRI